MVLAAKKRPHHHQNLRPKHKHTKQYLQSYWPYLPMLALIIFGLFILQPWQKLRSPSNVLGYATNVSIDGLLAATNQKRTAQAEPALQLSPELVRAAQAKAQDMVSRNYWSHTTPDGSAPWVFITQAGYSYKKAGENLAYGFMTDNEVIAGWMNSPTHRDNILDKTYSDAGFGFAQSPNFDGGGPVTVVVAMYGEPASSTATTASVPVSSQKLGFSTIQSSEPSSQSIIKAQTLTGGIAPWASYAVGILIGASFMYLLLKHGLAFRRMLVRGERFIIHHPLLDSTLVALIMVCVLVNQQAGIIR